MTPEPSKEEPKGVAPSKADLEKTKEITKGYFSPLIQEDEKPWKYFNEKIAQALAELRAEGERELQAMTKIASEKNSLAIDLLAEKSALEERVKALGEDCVQLQQTINCLEMDTVIPKLSEEITRLKAENERLRDFSKSYDVTENSVYQEAKKEISRLTASLAAAQESLRKIYEMPFSSGCGDEQRIAQEALSDKDGTLAFERWKAMLEEVNEARTILNLLGFHDWPKKKEIDDYLEKWKAMEAVVEAARACYEEDDFITENSPGSFERDKKLGEALEALDAKGGS